MLRCSLTTMAFAILTGVAFVAAQPPTPAQVQEEAAIRAVIDSYVADYNRADAAAVARHWSDEGEWVSPGGQRVRGRKNIEAEMAAVFKLFPGLQIDVGKPSVRFVSADVVMEEGTVQVTRGGESVSQATYLALHVKRDGQWQLDSVRETEIPDLVPPHEKLKDLGWMVGEWIDQADDSTVETKVTWTKNKRFLTCHFRVSLPGLEDLDGTQVIGWDAAAEVIRSWVFDSDGTIGEGTWSHDGNHWIVKSSQVLPGGARASATNIYTLTDSDHYTWKSIGRSVDGQFLPNVAEVQVVRKSAAAEVAAKKEPVSADAQAPRNEEPSGTTKESDPSKAKE